MHIVLYIYEAVFNISAVTNQLVDSQSTINMRTVPKGIQTMPYIHKRIYASSRGLESPRSPIRRLSAILSSSFAHVIYFPCRCLCLGFFELHTFVSIMSEHPSSVDLPDDVDSVLSPYGLNYSISKHSQRLAHSFSSNPIPCTHHTAASQTIVSSSPGPVQSVGR